MAYTAQYDVAVYNDASYDLLLLNCSGGSYTITGGDANFLYSQAIQAEAGSYVLTGSDATLDYDQILNAEAGAFTLTGNSATFIYDQTIYAGAFSFIWSGQQAGLIKDAVLNADAGAYTLTGNAVALHKNYVLHANAGHYAYTGKAATLDYTPNPVVYIETKGGIGKKKRTKIDTEREQREQLEAIVKREFDILDGTYEPEIIETVKSAIQPQITQIDYTQYAIALAQVNALLLQAKIQAAEYQAELDDEEALLMLL